METVGEGPEENGSVDPVESSMMEACKKEKYS
jgi:hypothetical protein